MPSIKTFLVSATAVISGALVFHRSAPEATSPAVNNGTFPSAQMYNSTVATFSYTPLVEPSAASTPTESVDIDNATNVGPDYKTIAHQSASTTTIPTFPQSASTAITSTFPLWIETLFSLVDVLDLVFPLLAVTMLLCISKKVKQLGQSIIQLFRRDAPQCPTPAEYQHMNELLQTSDEDNRVKQATINSLETALNASRQESNTKCNENQELDRRLSQLAVVNVLLQAKYDQQQPCELSQHEVDEHLREKAYAQKQCNLLSAELRNIKAERYKYDSRIKKTTKENTAIKKELQALQAACQDDQTTKNLEHQATTLRSQLESAQHATAQYNETIKSLTEANDSLRLELTESQHAISQHQADTESLESLKSQIDNLRPALKRSRRDNIQNNKACKSLRKQNRKLHQRLTEAEQAATSHDSTLESRDSAHHAEYRRLYEYYAEELKTYQAKNSELEERFTAADKLAVQNERSLARFRQREEASPTSAASDQQIISLRSQLSSADEITFDLEDRVESLQAEIVQLRGQLNEAEESVTRHNDTINSLNAENQTLRHQCEQNQPTISDYEGRITNYKAQIQDLSHQLGETQFAVRQHGSTVFKIKAAHSAELESLRDQYLTEANNKIKELEDQSNNKIKELEGQSNNKIKELEGQINNNIKELEGQANNKVKELEGQINNLTDQIQQTNGQLQQQNGQIQTQNAQLEEYRTAGQNLERELADQKGKTAEAEKTQALLSIELESCALSYSIEFKAHTDFEYAFNELSRVHAQCQPTMLNGHEEVESDDAFEERLRRELAEDAAASAGAGAARPSTPELMESQGFQPATPYFPPDEVNQHAWDPNAVVAVKRPLSPPQNIPGLGNPPVFLPPTPRPGRPILRPVSPRGVKARFEQGLKQAQGSPEDLARFRAKGSGSGQPVLLPATLLPGPSAGVFNAAAYEQERSDLLARSKAAAAQREDEGEVSDEDELESRVAEFEG